MSNGSAGVSGTGLLRVWTPNGSVRVNGTGPGLTGLDRKSVDVQWVCQG